MKYGYLFYQKPLIKEMKTRPLNIGDSIQSYAVKNLYREMGVAEEDIIPVPRYDMTTYDGEECVCVINTASNYEELSYKIDFLPPSLKIHAIPVSLHIHRDIPQEELEFYRTCNGVGCRDLQTMWNLQELGVDAYLSGCLTLTLPRRDREEEEKAKAIYLIDVPKSVYPYIPETIKNSAIELTNIIRYKNPGNTDRIPFEDACFEHEQGEKRLALLRTTAKLVITSKLHIASPCVAMGIPVIMVKDYYGERFGFIDRLLPLYTPDRYDRIDWNPKPVEFEAEKLKLKELVWNKIKAEVSRLQVEEMWSKKTTIMEISYDNITDSVICSLSACLEKNFKYAVWGVVLDSAYYLQESIQKYFPEASLIGGIDIASKYDFCGMPTIRPEEIENLEKDVIIFVPAPTAHRQARELLLPSGRRFVLIKDNEFEKINFI